MNSKNEVLKTSECEYDIFIAYYGGADDGTQRQAEKLFDVLNGSKISGGKILNVYQHTRCNPNADFSITPEIVARSKMFFLLADENIPTDDKGMIKKLMKRRKK